MTREPLTGNFMPTVAIPTPPKEPPFAERLLPQMTWEQIDAIARKAHQAEMPVEDLIVKAQATIGCDGAVTVPWCGMWLCIERDGYTHS